jgi:DNA-binding CsgD family transcriptional regulator/pimeloyl-ACP methyl ester carboxylesterase
MKPEIRYARTSDGVSIAYWSIGKGPVVIDLPVVPGDHVEKIWDVAEYHNGFLAIAEATTFVKYDARGFGLSDRGVERFSVDDMVLDLEAVVDALQLKRFVLNGWVQSAMPALSYAARHPDRVIALVLRDAFATGAHRADRVDKILELARSDWEAAARIYADGIPNVGRIASLKQLHEMVLATATQDDYIRFTEQSREWDVRDILGDVRMPVLVTNDGNVTPREHSQWLAAALPNASFVAHLPERGEVSPTEQAVEAFVRRVFEAEYRPPRTRPSPAPSSDGAASLTPRELEVLRLVAAGRSSRQIALELVLSERTVVRHISNIYAKIDAHGRAEATAYAIRHGLA